MTLAQASATLGASSKWVQNALARLGRPLAYAEADVRRLGLARLLVRLGLALPAAWRQAGAALARPDALGARVSADGIATLTIDVRRYLSHWAAAYARVLWRTPPGRGRPRRRAGDREGGLAAAARYGLDVHALAQSLERTPAERLRALDENRALVQALRARAIRRP